MWRVGGSWCGRGCGGGRRRWWPSRRRGRGGGGLPGSVAGLVAADDLPLGTAVVVTGVAAVDDPGHDYRHIDATGSWQGGTTRDEQTALGRIEPTSQHPRPGRRR